MDVRPKAPAELAPPSRTSPRAPAELSPPSKTSPTDSSAHGTEGTRGFRGCRCLARRRLSDEDPKDPEGVAAAARELQCQAREELIRDMRARPDACEELGLQGDFLDEDLLSFVARIENLRYALRTAGFSPADSVHIAELLPKALAAPRPQAPKPLCTCRCVFVILCLLGIIVLIVIIFSLIDEASAGYTRGICNIAGFGHSNSCVHKHCLLELLVRQAGKARSYYVKDWQPPLEPTSYREEQVKLRGDPFRCCPNTFSCCQILDLNVYAFCDAWPWLDDADGNPCPAGDWDCLFKADLKPNSEDIQKVTEVKVYEPPTLGPSIIGIVILSCLILFALLIPTFKKLGNILYLVATRDMRRRREEKKKKSEAASGLVVKKKRGSLQEEATENAVSVNADAVEGAGGTGNATPEADSAEALKMQSWRSHGVEKHENGDSLAPLPPDVSHMPARASGSAQVGSNLQHGRKGSKSSQHSDASKTSLKRGLVNQLNMPPPPSPIPEDVEAPADDLHPAFRTGDLSKYAQQPLGELLQPIIAPLPHSRFRTSSGRTLKIAGSPSSGLRPVSDANSISSHSARSSPSSGRRAVGDANSVSSHSTSRAGSQPPTHEDHGARQSLRVAAHGSDVHGFIGQDRAHRGKVILGSQSLSQQASPSQKIHSSPRVSARRSPGQAVISDRALKNATARGAGELKRPVPYS
mmetsp:Transcript_78819/g.149831  ORF Transcript_78819/g.149831 Transcript_78819/m.149831 type:complete len:696 (+) Transcript_78819:129-2216(+)